MRYLPKTKSNIGILALVCILPMFPLGQRNLYLGQDIPSASIKSLDGKILPLRAKNGKGLLVLWAKNYQRSKDAINDLAFIFRNSLELSDLLEVAVVFSDTVKKEAAGQVSQLKKMGLPFTPVFDVNGEAWDAFRVLAAPTVDLIDKNNKLQHHHAGYPQDFRKKIAITLAKVFKIAQVTLPAETEREAKARAGVQNLIFAKSLLQLGRIEKAFNTLEKAHRKWPANTDLTHFLGYLYLEKGRIKEARTLFKTLLKQNPSAHLANAGLAGCLIQEGELVAAKTMLTTQSTINKDSKYISYFLGVLAQKEAKWEAAAKHFQRAAKTSIWGY